MPRNRPATSGYARLSQADEEDAQYIDEVEEEDEQRPPRPPRTISSSYAPIQPSGHGPMTAGSRSGSSSPSGQRRRPGRRRVRSNSSGVDIKAINARLEKWADEIASKFKINKVKGKSHAEEQLEIHHSVFTAPEGVRPVTAEALRSEAWTAPPGRMNKIEYDDIVESVRTAIELGTHPRMISQGSSGSYFARNTDGKVVGVFKPKDEEPYASRNPKWTKWIHRNLFPCFFGRACLIPNLSYVSEAAAYTLDSRLQTNLVPYTDVVHLSSKAFYYDFWQRSAYYRKRKPLPEKPGSFQVFLKGFKDANIFLKDHPWPDHTQGGYRIDEMPRKRKWNRQCSTTPGTDDEDDEVGGGGSRPATRSGTHSPAPERFRWTDAIQQSFREELEKLVILDYIMRNTDRGLDNWMVKVDSETQTVSIVTEPVKMNGDIMGSNEDRPHPVTEHTGLLDPYRRQEAMSASSRSGTPTGAKTAPVPNIALGAIDNSLSWPWKHPDAWRSFPFGWLFLPVSLIGQPFSQKTRDHFLPLLTSKDWWSGTQIALRRIFEQDDDFKERMFARQMAVMKGQAWNVVETLKIADHGPLELTRRARICVWDDLVDVPVAIPMRQPSIEQRYNLNGDLSVSDPVLQEEMDITGAAVTSKPKQHSPDLLGGSPPPGDLPNPNRFDLSRNASGTDVTQLFNHEPGSPSAGAGDLGSGTEARDFASKANGWPAYSRSKSHQMPFQRASGDFPRGHRSSSSIGRSRFSFSSVRNVSSFMYDDDAEGDLGYSSARHKEKHTRKVIVERLETVKSKNPVFSWC